MADAYVAIDWHVKTGREEAFVERWRETLEWLTNTFSGDGFERARLVRDEDDPLHFVSFIEWEDRAAIDRWDGHAQKQPRQVSLVQLCDDVHGCIGSEAT